MRSSLVRWGLSGAWVGLLCVGGCAYDVGVAKNSVCDGEVNGSEVTVDDAYDRDGDGYFDGANPDCAATYEAAVLDCNDAEAGINPGLAEVPCDSLDNDCDEATLDEDDFDEDGVTSCEDCDDTNADINPYVPEITCNGVDDDCREDTPDLQDVDTDGYDTCSDCDDSHPDIHPGMGEVACNGLDDDCNPSTLDGEDLDGDGHSSCDDCDDFDAEIYPGHEDICENGIDENCSGADAICSYSDTWDLDQSVTMSCALNNVVINFNKVYIDDQYPTIAISAVSGSLPASLNGTFTNATDFETSATIPGGCTEKYDLDGFFLSDTEFQGVFTATFTGGLGCLDCDVVAGPNNPDFSWTVTGTR